MTSHPVMPPNRSLLHLALIAIPLFAGGCAHRSHSIHPGTMVLGFHLAGVTTTLQVVEGPRRDGRLTGVILLEPEDGPIRRFPIAFRTFDRACQACDPIPGTGYEDACSNACVTYDGLALTNVAQLGWLAPGRYLLDAEALAINGDETAVAIRPATLIVDAQDGHWSLEAR